MGKAILISIRPKWCELIASGQKTVEVRKTKPNAILPLKCYIYCTKPSFPHEDFLVFDVGTNKVKEFYGGGKVIGEFVCHNIFPLSFYASEASFFDTEPPMNVPGTCLTDKEIVDYLGNGKTGYGWLISDIVVYDEPKELSEFWKWYKDGADIRPCQNGKHCKHLIYDYSEDCQACAIDFDGTDCPFLRVTRPPQSWCYVEELQSPPTNANRIRSMSDEELAEFFEGTTLCDSCFIFKNECGTEGYSCAQRWLEWLRQEATDGV